MVPWTVDSTRSGQWTVNSGSGQQSISKNRSLKGAGRRIVLKKQVAVIFQRQCQWQWQWSIIKHSDTAVDAGLHLTHDMMPRQARNRTFPRNSIGARTTMT